MDVILDTNIIVSLLLTSNSTATLIKQAIHGERFQPVASWLNFSDRRQFRKAMVILFINAPNLYSGGLSITLSERVFMGREERKKLISAIEKKRGSRVITYITSDRQNSVAIIAGDTVPVIHEHILSLRAEDRKKLDLFLYSRGGDSNVPWQIVSMIREYCEEGNFSVLIPYRAHSAATMIALGADEIVMTKKAELGPIDTTMRGPYNNEGRDGQPKPISVEDVMGYFALLERIGDVGTEEKVAAFKNLTDHVHPMALGNVSRILQQTELVASRLLNTRAKPFNEEENERIAKMFASEIYNHEHSISRIEAQKHMGIDFIVKSEDAKVDKEMWALYLEYRDLFELDEPFSPESHMVENNLEEHTWHDVPLACIESEARFDTFRHSVKLRRLRDIPPQINLNFNNVGLPPVHISDLPQGLTPENLNAIVQQAVGVSAQHAIDAAVQRATEQFLKSLPTTGFETASYGGKWRREE